jgi:hypothetical protein
MLYIKVLDRDLLKAFEEEVLSLELMEPNGVDHEDSIVVDILEAGECNEHLPVIKMYSMYWPGYKNQCCTFIGGLACLCCWDAGTPLNSFTGGCILLLIILNNYTTANAQQLYY